MDRRKEYFVWPASNLEIESRAVIQPQGGLAVSRFFDTVPPMAGADILHHAVMIMQVKLELIWRALQRL